MSTQTGIRPNDKLREFFAKCREESLRDKYRLIKVVISNEELCLEEHAETSGDWRKDWNKLVLKVLDNDEPCYIFYRLDEKESSAYRWVLISWSPDSSSVRNKMLYASTKATLKQEFGGGHVKDDIYGNVREDVSLEGYDRHCVSAAAPGPLSREEEEREEVRLAQSQVAVGVDTKQQTMTNIAFPFTQSAIDALKKFKDEETDYVQLSIETSKEIIELEKSSSCSVKELPKKVPESVPRYHLFRFNHTHEGDYIKSATFIYTMPGYNCSIKERMLYSSCRNAVVEVIESIGIEVAKKIEVDSGSELTEEFLMDEIHPKKSLNRSKFARPAPPNRGNRRITKAPPTES